ncbi:hypothetical protein SK128_009091 [Halocaridina rubra]|uniref:Uncharacterized protein n=1 Tax=Halocaridina rubra TaxID=373956 RepID=A0AAN8WNR9_HALRR
MKKKNNAYITFHGDTGERAWYLCVQVVNNMKQSLWENSLGIKVLSDSNLMANIQTMPYDLTSQQILVGSLYWLLSILRQRTQWLWIVSNVHLEEGRNTSNALKPAGAASPSSGRSPWTSSPASKPNYKRPSDIAMEEFSSLLRVDFNGVLLMEEQG